jgi:hypothetical protein
MIGFRRRIGVSLAYCSILILFTILINGYHQQDGNNDLSLPESRMSG